jgi:hypothetical protein
MSSSVQFEIGKTRRLSPFALRALYSRQSSGRWFLGSQWWLAERTLMMRLLQSLGLPQVGVHAAVIERVDPARQRLGIAVDQQFHSRRRRRPLAQFVHRLELPSRIDMEQRERRCRREERLLREMQHYCRILADRIQHHRTHRLGDDFAQDVDAFGLETLEGSTPDAPWLWQEQQIARNDFFSMRTHRGDHVADGLTAFAKARR